MTYGYGDERDDRRPPPRPGAGPDNQSYPPPAGAYGQGYPAGYDESGADQGFDPFATQHAPRGDAYGRPAPEVPPGQQSPAYGQPYGGQPEYYGNQPGYNQQYPQPNYGQQPDYGNQAGYPQPGYEQPAYEQPGYGQPPYQPPPRSHSAPPSHGAPTRHQGYPEPGYGQGTYHQGYEQPGYEQPGYAQPTSGYPRSDRGGYPDQSGYDPAYPPRSAPRPTGTGVYGRPRATAPHTAEAGGYGLPQQYSRPSYEPSTGTSPRYSAPDPEPEAPARRGAGKIVAISIVVLGLIAAAVGGGLWWAHRNTTANPAPARSAVAAIADRVKDPKPLTVAEVYGPNAVITSTSPAGKYKVLGSQLSADCGVAVTDALVTLLKTAGCNQVVRGTLTSPDGTYVITAGIFNLKDSSAATQVYSDIMNNVTGGKGRFTGFATGGAGDVITQAQANLAWDSVGHYLVYCVIALADGKPIAKDDKATKDIIQDVVESYLGDKVISNRAATAGSPAPSGSASK